MKLIIFYNMERTRFGRWFMEGFPAKFHAIPFLGIMTFTGPKEWAREQLVKHELIHFYQAQREGALLWNIRYYWYLWRIGYMANPYEIEAYARMDEPLTDEERELVNLHRGKCRACSVSLPHGDEYCSRHWHLHMYS